MPNRGPSWQRTAALTRSFPPDVWGALLRLPGQVVAAAAAVDPAAPVGVAAGSGGGRFTALAQRFGVTVWRAGTARRPVRQRPAGKPPSGVLPPGTLPSGALSSGTLSSGTLRSRLRMDRPGPGVAATLAGLGAIAAGRGCGSPLVRDVVSAIYLEDAEPGAPGTDLAGSCTAVADALATGARREDADAYRCWLEAIAAQVCRARSAPAVFVTGGPALTPAQWRFVTDLRAALKR
jgi:hypothetical protein